MPPLGTVPHLILFTTDYDMATEVNPLIHIPFRVPFDLIRAEHVRPAMAELLRETRERLEVLASSAEPRAWENTMAALDELTEPLDLAMGVVRHLEAVATYPELRAAHNDVEPEVSAFYSGIPLNEGLWRNIKSYAGTEEGRRLEGTRRRFLEKTVDTFRRHGAELDAAGKASLKQIDVELAVATTKFSENVLDATNAWDLVIADEAKLAGLPPMAVAMARQSALQKGMEGWRFTLQAPSYVALMTYLDDAGIRREAYHAFSVRASGGQHDNRGLLARILERSAASTPTGSRARTSAAARGWTR
jgi:oligopeptidase A